MEKLAEFLDKLSRKEFNFAEVVSEANIAKKCGTVCCAMGWTPVVFPRLVEFSLDEDEIRWSDVVFKKSGERGYVEVAEELFEISYAEAEYLFTPNQQHYLGVKDLGNFATPIQAAKLLRKYMAKVKKGDYNETS